jgi:hypothetical protein
MDTRFITRGSVGIKVNDDVLSLLPLPFPTLLLLERCSHSSGPNPSHLRRICRPAMAKGEVPACIGVVLVSERVLGGFWRGSGVDQWMLCLGEKEQPEKPRRKVAALTL